MIPERLLNKLKCLNCGSSSISEIDEKVTCSNCGSEFGSRNGIPSILRGQGAEDQDWNSWDRDEFKAMGNSYYKRAKGELEEKEATKSMCKFMQEHNLWQQGEEFLDIGCATGFIAKSLRERLDRNIKYTGIDITSHFLQWGQEIFGLNEINDFVHADVLNMPFQDKVFDVVWANLYHFFPNLKDALTEASRVAKKYVIWRTPVGQVNYMMRIYTDNDYSQIGVITPNLTKASHTNYQLYTVDYVKDLVHDIGGKVIIAKKDSDFGVFDNTVVKGFENVPSTKVVNGMQVNGNIVLDWWYFVIEAQ